MLKFTVISNNNNVILNIKTPMCPQIIKQVDKNNIFSVTKLPLPKESNQTSLSILLSHKAIQINIFLFFPLIYI